MFSYSDIVESMFSYSGIVERGLLVLKPPTVPEKSCKINLFLDYFCHSVPSYGLLSHLEWNILDMPLYIGALSMMSMKTIVMLACILNIIYPCWICFCYLNLQVNLFYLRAYLNHTTKQTLSGLSIVLSRAILELRQHHLIWNWTHTRLSLGLLTVRFSKDFDNVWWLVLVVMWTKVRVNLMRQVVWFFHTRGCRLFLCMCTFNKFQHIKQSFDVCEFMLSC